MKKQMQITTILLVSRIQYLDRVIDSLLKQTYPVKNLLVVFNGSDAEFIEVRNKIMELKLEQKVCVKADNTMPAVSIPVRRINISNIHNQIRGILPPPPTLIEEDYEPSWIFSIEDDGILPPHALANLVEIAETHSDAGMITGVELGRWGVPYVGAWRADNFENPKTISSLENKTLEGGIEEIDACGLYCALIRQDFYTRHTFTSANGLGPDVNLGLFLRQFGFKNYIDWSVHVTHLTHAYGLDIEIPATDRSRLVKMTHKKDDVWAASTLT